MTRPQPPEQPTVLVVDDEPKIGRLVVQTFRPEGFEVLLAHDGAEGVELVETERPDLVLLDLVMPGMDGLHACRRIRELSDVPIIMLTSRAAEGDRLRGFQLGVDDYVAKPFSPAELVARARAVLRRARPPTAHSQPPIDDGVLRIDLERGEALLHGQPVTLSRTERRLLLALAGNAGHVLLHEELKRRVWGDEYAASDDQLRTYVRYLRRKLEPDPARPRYLLGQRGVGYVFRSHVALMDGVAWAAPASSGGARMGSLPSGAGGDPVKTVMLVDDEPAIRRIVHITLGGQARYRLLHAEGGRDALKLVGKQRVDLALVDVAMPDLDGFSVCKALKSLPKEVQPQVVMLTAQSGTASRARGQAAGADDYMTKPFSPSALIETVERLLAEAAR